MSEILAAQQKIFEKPNTTKEALFSAKNIKNSITKNSPEVFDFLNKSYFDPSNMERKKTSQKMAGTPLFDLRKDKDKFVNSYDFDLQNYFGDEKYSQYTGEGYKMEYSTEEEINNAVFEVQKQKTQEYIANIDDQNLREKTEDYAKRGNLLEIFTDKDNSASAERYMELYIDALDQEDQFKIKAKKQQGGKVDLTRAAENLKQLTAINEGQGPAGKVLSDFYKFKYDNVLLKKQAFDVRDVEFKKAKETFDVGQNVILNDIEGLGISRSSSEQDKQQYVQLFNQYELNLNSYNSAVERKNLELTEFNNDITKLDNISVKINDANFYAQNFGLAYTFGDKALLSIEQGLTDMAGYAVGALAVLEEGIDVGANIIGEDYDKNDIVNKINPDLFGSAYRATIDYNESLKNYTQSIKPMNIKYEDLKFTGPNSNFGEAVNQLMGNNIFSIGAAITYGGVVKLGAKGLISITNAQATSILGNTFFGLEAGGKLGEMEISQRNAQKTIDFYQPKYEEALKNPDTPKEILLKYRQELDRANGALNVTQFEKAFVSTTFGGVAKYAEKVGTMGYVRKLSMMTDVVGPLSFSNVIRGAGGIAFNTGIEYVEEGLTLAVHNLTDIAVLKQDKSVFEGLDADFNMNVLFSTLAIQAPSTGMNIYNTISSEVSTFNERKQNIKNRDEIVELQLEIDYELNRNKTSSGVSLEPSIESKQRLDYLRAERDKIFRKSSLETTYTFAEVASMSSEDILELFEINRKIRAEGKNASNLGSMQSGQKKNDYVDTRLQKIKDRVNALENKREELRKKPELRRKKDLEDLLGKENLTVEDYFFVGKFEQSININRGLGKKIKVFKDVKDEEGNVTSSSIDQIETFLTKQVENNKITEELKKEYLKGFKQGANASYIGNTTIASQENVYRNIQLAQNGLEKSIMAYAIFHEQMHQNDESIGLVKDNDISLENEFAVKEMETALEEKYKQGRIKEKDYKVIVNRLNSYKAQGKYLAEIMPLVAELMDAGVIQENTNLEVSLRLLFNKVLRKTFKDNDVFFKFRNAKDISAYVASFRRGVRNLTAAGTVPEKDLKKPKLSKGTPLQAINALLPNSVKTKEDYNNFISDGKRNKVLFDALKNNGVISNYVKARATSDEIPLILQNVSDRMIGLVGKGFDPTIKREDGTTVGNEGFGEYIFANTNFSQMDARKTLAIRNEEENKTKRIDATKATSEGEVGFDLEDTEQLSPEEQMIEREDQQQLTPEQLESQIKKDLNLTDEVIEKVKQAVRKTYGTKLPDIRSKKYRTKLKDALVVELKKEIQDIFGREQDYNKFLTKYMPSLHNNLSADRLVQIERRVPKGKKIFVDSKRITSVKEVRKLQEQGLIRKEVKPASGPNLNTKLKTPSNEQIIAFFRGTNMQDVLGYTVGKSTFGTRKDALAEAVVEKVGFDATINILNKELNVAERMRGVQEITGIEQLENDVQVIADVLNVNPNISLSLGIEITGIQVIEQFNELLTLAQDKKTLAAFLDLETKPKYNGVPILSAIYDPIKNLANKGGLLKDTMLNTALKKVFGSIVKLQGEKNLGDVGERVTYNLFKEAGILAPDHQLSEKKVNIKPFFTFKGGKFQNADIVFVLENGQEVALEIKFAASGTVNAGKITISSYDSKGNFTFSDPTLPQFVKDIVTKGSSAVFEVIKEFENLLISDFGYPKGINLNEIKLPEISPYKSLDNDPKSLTFGKMINKIIFVKVLGNNPVWHKKIEAVKKKSNITIDDDGSVSTYLYNKKGNFYVLFIGEGKGKGLYYLGQDPLNTAKELGVTSAKGGHGVKFRLLSEGSVDTKGNKTYGFRLNPEAFFNTNNIEKTSDFNIRNKKNVQQFKKAVNKSTFAQLDQPVNRAVFSKAIEQGRKIKESKGITILDFDDTLATSKSMIKFTRPDGTKGELNAEQYASTYEDLLDLNYTFDFSEFSKVVKGKTAPLFQKALKLQSKFGPENMFVLTARPADSASAIFAFLQANGLNIPLKNITGLANSTSEAKALWIAGKVGEGYNDFYFADDALQNVQAVKNMLDQFDVKSKVQQAKVKFSEGMSADFNKIIQELTSIDAKKRFGNVKARKRGTSKGKFRYFIPPSHEDFVGLLYNFIGKGKLGNQHRDFFEQALIRPLNRAFRELNTAKQSVANDYKALKKQFPELSKIINKKLKGVAKGDYTYADAIRVYLWDKHSHKIPGLNKIDQKALVDFVKSDNDMLNFAESLNIISKQKEYVSATEHWEVGDIRTDLEDATGRVGRAQFFEEFNENVNKIFSKENLNKIEAGYGEGVRESLEDMIYRIKSGRNRPTGSNKIVNRFLDYLNASIGGVMFFNMRSSILQQLSIVNFINFEDNNLFNAAKAFANQKQYWADWLMIFNSDMLKQRRGGLTMDVNAQDIASYVSKSKQPIRALFKKLLTLGFKPTQISDSMAIASGGSTFYRNRVNTYLTEGLSQKEAESKAFIDFEIVAESTQQSARPDMISSQQSSVLGWFILGFQNVTSQYARIIKKSATDLIKRRISPPYKTQEKSDMANVSRILYYGFVQNIIFYTLQTALFAAMFQDEEDEDFLTPKKQRILNGTIDSLLRGSGVLGAIVSTLKNMAFAFFKERGRDWNNDESSVLVEALNLSPPLGIKARKIVNAEKTINYNKKVIDHMETFDIDNPAWSATTNYIEGITTAPTNRIYNKVQNLRQVANNQNSLMQRLFMFWGWSQYNLGVENVKIRDAKQASKGKSITL